MRRVLKWQIPVDDRDHPIGSGPVVLVDTQDNRWEVVTVWTDEPDVDDVVLRSARVYGTGQPVPDRDEHVGSVVVGALVWHVFASTRPAAGLEVAP